jgi:hypothetical protein
MSNRVVFAMVSDFQARIAKVLPGVSPEDLEGLARLVLADRLLGDDGSAHPDLVAWVRRILDRDAGQAAPVLPAPVPKTGPVGAEVAA